MTRAQAVRLVAMLGSIEMGLVRKDPVVGPLLAQARRAAADTEVADYLDCAATITRQCDINADNEASFHARKVVQALCRAAAQSAQAAALT